MTSRHMLRRKKCIIMNYNTIVSFQKFRYSYIKNNLEEFTNMGKEKSKNPFELSPAEKIKREKGFILDSVAVGTLSVDRDSYNPKHATGIPPYNAQKDRAVREYFKSPSVKSALKKTGQVGFFFSYDFFEIFFCNFFKIHSEPGRSLIF